LAIHENFDTVDHLGAVCSFWNRWWVWRGRARKADSATIDLRRAKTWLHNTRPGNPRSARTHALTHSQACLVWVLWSIRIPLTM